MTVRYIAGGVDWVLLGKGYKVARKVGKRVALIVFQFIDGDDEVVVISSYLFKLY